ncbi:hypothetical protein PGB90_003757 [Kerria lacca]
MRTITISDASNCPSGSNIFEQPHSPTYHPDDVLSHFDFHLLDNNIQKKDINITEKENFKDSNAVVDTDTDDDYTGGVSYAPTYIEASNQQRILRGMANVPYFNRADEVELEYPMNCEVSCLGNGIEPKYKYSQSQYNYLMQSETQPSQSRMVVEVPCHRYVPQRRQKRPRQIDRIVTRSNTHTSMVSAQNSSQTVSSIYQSQVIETVMAESDTAGSTNINDAVLAEIIHEFGDIAIRDYPPALFDKIRNSKASSWFKRAVVYRTKSAIHLSEIYN